MSCRPFPDAAWLILGFCFAGPQQALAHRPFDVIDASVADARTLETELGMRHQVRARSDGNAMPLGFAFGIDGLTEIGIAARTHAAGGGRRIRDLAFTVKRVLRRGSMQDAAGPSIAAECALPVPAMRSEDAGGVLCAFGTSQRTAAADFHLNAGASRSHDGQAIRHAGAALEGPHTWPLRPIAELTAQRAPGQRTTYARLLGASWHARPDLSFGVALHRVQVAGARVDELRFGLTWTSGS